MLEVLQFALSDIYHFIGTAFLLAIFLNGVAEVTWALFNRSCCPCKHEGKED